MFVLRSLVPSSLSCLLLLATSAFAQSDCEGDTTVYEKDGLIVPFRNLCGKDILAVVDFLDPTNEETFYDCLSRCVEKEPLCYGFDFTSPGFTDFNCWLMNATFEESDAVEQPYTVDAAMLTSAFVLGLSDDCETLGLAGCFEKNGHLGNGPAPSSTSRISTSTTAASTGVTSASTATTEVGSGSENEPEPTSEDRGLSTGAKAGIGAGVGAAVLLVVVIVAFVCLKRRKRRSQEASNAAYPHASGKPEDDLSYGHGPSELPVDQNQFLRSGPESAHTSPGATAKNSIYGVSELESPRPFSTASHPPIIHEIDDSRR